jgi:hypothetical protein
MKIVRRSIYSGIVRTRDLDVTQDQLRMYEETGDVHKSFPNLSQEDRIFFVSGITDEDWDDSTVSIGDKRDR